MVDKKTKVGLEKIKEHFLYNFFSRYGFDPFYDGDEYRAKEVVMALNKISQKHSIGIEFIFHTVLCSCNEVRIAGKKDSDDQFIDGCYWYLDELVEKSGMSLDDIELYSLEFDALLYNYYP